ncbi:hypothetical protein J437_LFUL005885 [Ladona fulva]|uniref:Uncharacterized protein n=1 Tax=Ladona fulva TaxID=123851 RepID=A0A8K0P3M8_LADFU|nr:hypothetical protein J437_LFUL005885 [Ladona fulva]
MQWFGGEEPPHFDEISSPTLCGMIRETGTPGCLTPSWRTGAPPTAPPARPPTSSFMDDTSSFLSTTSSPLED